MRFANSDIQIIRRIARAFTILGLCLGVVSAVVAETGESGKAYQVLDDELGGLVAEFNANMGRVRQVYLLGPTCGICLRGMADMDEALVASRQDDPRLITLAVHLPTMGAEERHVAPTIHLLDGPQVRHYWDPSGRTGAVYQQALGLPIYAWDIWMVYGPDARWAPGELPPEPAFWQHQLSPMVDDWPRLDPEEFAAEVVRRVEMLEVAQASGAENKRQPMTDERALIRVAQPRGMPIQQHLMQRGTYPRLKTIREMTFDGALEMGERRFPLRIHLERPARRVAQIQTHDGPAAIEVEDGQITRTGDFVVPSEVTDPFLHAFEFDGWLMEWKDKGHQVSLLGMIRDDKRLPWLMEVEHRNGQTWHLYLDSHTGDAYRKVLVDEQGVERIAVEYGDFRDVDGFRVPFQATFFQADEKVATQYFDAVTISRAEAS